MKLEVVAATLLLAGFVAEPCPTTASSRSSVPDVRVRLLQDSRPDAVVVSIVSGSFRMVTSGDNLSAPMSVGSKVSISRRGARLRLVAPAGESTLSRVRLQPDDDAAIFSVQVHGGGKSITRSYNGAVDFRTAPDDEQALMIINHVPLESYVAAVVTSEYGLDDIEGTKAMAVLARTYAVNSLGQAGTDYDHVDHALSQVYRGVDGLSSAALDAALATAGEVVLYKGSLAEAVYHAESGGHTADNDAVWNGRPVDYLRGVADPFANNSPYASWTFSADRTRLLRALSGIAGRAVSGLTIERRSDDGRVSEVRLLARAGAAVNVSGNEFRLAVIREFGAAALKSTRFDVSTNGAVYRFTGTGFGHGVGVSQWGAHEMARRGYTYDEIIAFYLRGTEVARVADLAPDITPLAAAEPKLALPFARQNAADSTAGVRRTTGPVQVTNVVDRPKRKRIGW